MGNSLFTHLSKKIGKIPGQVVVHLVIFFCLRGMIFYIGQRMLLLFSSSSGYRFLLSLLLAFIWLTMNICYLAKHKILHCIWSISLLIFVILAISTLILALEQLLHPNIKIPGIGIILFIVAIITRGFITNRHIIITPLIIKSSKIQTDKKIVFISDLHADLLHSRRYLQKIVDKILEEAPDMVLVWGDFINIPQENYIAYFQVFQKIKVPTYAVIGNHDIYFGPDTHIIERIFKIGKIIPLRNQTINLWDIQLVGIDDKELWGKKKLNTLLEECKMNHNGKFTIFLTHRPIRLSKLAHTPIDLELAGHTHKGQIRGLHLISRLVNDYTYGKATRKGKIAFTSQGVGTRTPFRIWTEGEIVVIHLISQ